MRPFIAVAIAATVLLSACSGDDSAADSPDPSPTTGASPTSAADAPKPAAAAAGEVVLTEWAVAAGPIASGSVTLTVRNDGDFDHELLVVKGKFADLPKTSSGTVDEDALADALISKSDEISSGASATLTAELPSGDYSLFCNLSGGGSSHASRGQVLDVTVA